jgi:hypothetical protein
MPAPSVKLVFTDFHRQVKQGSSLLDAAKIQGIPFFQLEEIAELSFLKVYLAWERFLEEAFARYLCGARSVGGFLPRSYAEPRNLDHARQLVMMAPQRILRYADWANRELIIRRAELVFRDGKPFVQPLQAGALDLDDMGIIRNRIAHGSAHAKEQFLKLVHRRLGVAYPFAPGRFLLRRVPNASDTFLSFFCTRILLVAEQIVR